MLRRVGLAAILAAGALMPASASAQDARPDRFPQLKPETMTDAQRHAATGLPALNGPFNIMLRSPVLTDRIQALAQYLRAPDTVPPRLAELAILITARQCTAQYAWWGHYPMAIKAGLAAAVANDLAHGVRPMGMKADEAAVYDFLTELHDRQAVTDATFRRAKDVLGERGLVDLIGLAGLYQTVGMMLDAGAVGLPEGAVPLPPLAQGPSLR